MFKRFRDLELSPVLLCGASLLAFAAVLALVKGSSPSTAGAATGASSEAWTTDAPHLVVVVPTTAPAVLDPATTSVSVSIAPPAPTSKVTTSKITIAGKSAPGSTVTVKGLSVVANATGDFSTVVDLEPGPNSIEVVAVDPSGNPTKATVIVDYEVPAGDSTLVPPTAPPTVPPETAATSEPATTAHHTTVKAPAAPATTAPHTTSPPAPAATTTPTDHEGNG